MLLNQINTRFERANLFYASQTDNNSPLSGCIMHSFSIRPTHAMNKACCTVFCKRTINRRYRASLSCAPQKGREMCLVAIQHNTSCKGNIMCPDPGHVDVVPVTLVRRRAFFCAKKLLALATEMLTPKGKHLLSARSLIEGF
jgi:hypothetical protein